MKLSETSAAMAIFLGKNMLGQTDKQETEIQVKEKVDDGFLKALNETAKEVFKDDGEDEPL